MIRRRLLQLFAAALFPFDTEARSVAAYHAQTVLPTDGDEAMPVEQAIRELIDNTAVAPREFTVYRCQRGSSTMSFHVRRIDGSPPTPEDMDRICKQLAEVMGEVFEKAGREAGA